MTDNIAAFQATVDTYRLNKTQPEMKIVLSVPIEMAERVTRILGWPVPGTDIHVAVARVAGPAE
jgi:hypothetical protein